MPDNETPIDRLYHDPALARFYDLENGWGADFDYCCKLAEDAGSVLDLGCGTGTLAARLTEGGREVTGVDPADAMLEIARRRPGGQKATWVEADARVVRLGRTFDLVVLTGHAFQVFLTDQDQAAVLSTIAAHLAPGGRFIFDTRNPLVFDCARPEAPIWHDWRPDASRRQLQASGLGRVEAWSDVAHDAASGIATYQTHYRIAASGEEVSAASQIRFADQVRLAAMIDRQGLAAEQWFGDWRGSTFEAASPDIIPLGGLR